MGTLQISGPARRALTAFLIDPAEELTALEVCSRAGVRVGSLHAALARLEGMGWLESRWADPDPAGGSTPTRRCYRLTGSGVAGARLAEEQAHHPIARLRWRPVAGQS